MNRFIAFMASLLLACTLLQAADSTSVTVTVTKRAPIETLSPTGDITGATESAIGTHLTLVSVSDGRLIVQDDKGNHYRIAQDATDYTPPVVATPPPPVPVAANPPPTPAPNQPAKPATSNPAPAPVADATPVPDNPITVKITNRPSASEMSVWPEGGLPDRPLLIAAHGNGGSGPKEINGWLKLAKAHRFTIVCPSFLSSVNTSHLGEDDPYFKECLKWVKENLKYNPDDVFMTGFSGGGFGTWYLATQRPDFFHGLIFESGNFAGGIFNLNLSHWFNKPIKLIWGSEDIKNIITENENAVNALKGADCKDYTTEVVPGAHHQEHPEMVISWMEQNLAPASSN